MLHCQGRPIEATGRDSMSEGYISVRKYTVEFNAQVRQAFPYLKEGVLRRAGFEHREVGHRKARRKPGGEPIISALQMHSSGMNLRVSVSA